MNAQRRKRSFLRRGLLALESLALCMVLMPAVGATATTWTYTPELRRLDADGNEMPAGEIEVERDGILRVGLYVGVLSVPVAEQGPDLESRGVAMKYALAGFGREVGGNVIEMIGQRGAMRDIEIVESYVAIGGRQLDLDALGFGEGGGGGLSGWVNTAMDFAGIDLESDQGLFWEAAQAAGISSGRLNLDLLPDVGDLLRGSSFEMPLGDGRNGEPSRWTLWGVGGSMSAFQGRPEDRFSMDGEVFAGHLGLDYRVNDTLLAGTIVSRSSGDVDYRFSGPVGDDGGVRMDLTSAHPYVHWEPVAGLTVWGSVGIGRGSARLADDKGEADTDIAMTMLAMGSRRELMSVGRIDLAMKADAFLVQMQSDEREFLPGVAAQTSRVRLVLEGSRNFALSPTWGTPSTGAEGMWNSTRATQAVLATGGAPLGMHVDTRLGYGMNLSNGGGVLTLFSEVGQPDGGPAHLRFGTQLARLRTNGSQLDFELIGERINPTLNEDPSYGIVLNARGRF